MRLRTLAGVLALGGLTALALPAAAEAGHRHSRHCGHGYGRGYTSPRHGYQYGHRYAPYRYGYDRYAYSSYGYSRPYYYGPRHYSYRYDRYRSGRYYCPRSYRGRPRVGVNLFLGF